MTPEGHRHDRRADLSGLPVARCGRADLGVRDRGAAFAAARPPSGRWRLRPGAVRSSSGVEMLARSTRPPAAITTLIVAGRRGRAAGGGAATGRLPSCAAWPSAACASPASAPAPISWPKPACSTASAPPRTGSARSISSRPIPRSSSSPTRSSCATATSGPRPASPPASTCRWRWSRKIMARRSRSKTARQLVLYHRRSGGQSQFSSLLELKAPTGRFAPLLAWARENLDAPLTVEDMAERAGMSARHFSRAFIAETGTTPSKAVERLRIEVAQAARAVLERSDRARRRDDRLSRSRADAPRLHPRLRPAAAIAAARGAGGLRRVPMNPGCPLRGRADMALPMSETSANDPNRTLPPPIRVHVLIQSGHGLGRGAGDPKPASLT